MDVDIAIIGSSRGFQFTNEYFKKDIVNYSVGAAGYMEHLAFSKLSEVKNNPKTIIFIVDPWIFRSAYGKKISPLLWNEYKVAVKELNSQISPCEYYALIRQKYDQLFSIDYTINSIKRLIKFDKVGDKLVPTNCIEQSLNVICADGGLKYNLDFYKKTPSEIFNSVDKETKDIFADNYTEKDFIFSYDKYQNFLQYVNKISIKRKVILLLAPFHPLAFDRISNRTNDFFKSEILLSNEKLNPNIELVGSYSPYIYGCVNSDFLDAYHPKISCFNKFFIN